MSWCSSARIIAPLLMLTGCALGGTDESSSRAATPTQTATVTMTVTPTSAPSTTASLPPAITGPTVTRAQVSSPTGNIWCDLEYGVVCLVWRNDYAPLPEQRCEAGDWTDSWFYDGKTSGIRGGCQSDTPFGAGQPPSLAYGSTALRSGNACRSTESGMTCWDTRSDHGFRVSRSDYDLF